jgi:hypothetical protein
MNRSRRKPRLEYQVTTYETREYRMPSQLAPTATRAASSRAGTRRASVVLACGEARLIKHAALPVDAGRLTKALHPGAARHPAALARVSEA